MSLTNCRYYEEKYPEIDSFVMVNVKQVRLDLQPRIAGRDTKAGVQAAPAARDRMQWEV